MSAVGLNHRRRSDASNQRSTWDSTDLERRLALALEIAERAVSVLGTEGYGGDGRDAVRPEKVLAETALLLVASHHAVAAAVHQKELASRFTRLAEALARYGRNERVAALVTLEPSVSLEHAFVHIALGRIGMPDERFDRLLENAQRAQAAASRERLPHRRLEQAWMRRLARIDDARSAHAIERMDLRTSILARPLDALASTADDRYAYTHGLMYACDLGSRLPQLPRTRRAIAADAEAALGACLDEQDFDLAGEVLLTWPLLRRGWPATATFGFSCLAEIEDATGFLPALSVSTEKLAALAGNERTRYAVAMSYHTAYVMGLLCALSLRPGREPRVTVPTSRRAHGATEAIQALARGMQPTAEPRLWEMRFEALTEGQRDALAPLMLAIHLRRAVITRDLVLVQALLRVAAAHDLLEGPAPSQALELLDRARQIEREMTSSPPT
jgi:uncharacterized protein DUF6895